jgi:hypothetical protein
LDLGFSDFRFCIPENNVQRTPELKRKKGEGRGKG